MTDTEVFPQAKPKPSPWDDAAASLASEQQGALRRNLKVAQQVKPDEHAHALEVAARNGVALPVAQSAVRGGLDVQEATGQWDKLFREQPAFAAWMRDPNNAALAQDDRVALEKVIGAARGSRDDSLLGLGNAIETGYQQLSATAPVLAAAKGLIKPQDAAKQIAAVYQRLDAARAQTPEFALEAQAVDAKESADIQAQYRRMIDGIQSGDPSSAFTGAVGTVAETIQGLLSYVVGNPRGVLYTAAETLVPSLPAITHGAAGFAVGGPAGMAAGVAIGEFPVEFSGWFAQEMQARGVVLTDEASVLSALNDPAFMAEANARANRKALTTAGIDAAFAFTGGRSVSAAKGLKAKAAAAAQEVLVQAGGEAASEAGGQLAATGDIEEVDVGESVMEGVATIGQSVAEVGIGTLARRAEVSQRQVVETVQQAVQAVQDAEALTVQAEAVQEAKTHTRSPGRTQQLVDAIAGGAGVADVQVAIDGFDRVYAKEPGGPVKAATDLLGPAGEAAYHEAHQIGHLSVPVGLYESKLGGTPEWESLKPDVRVRPGGLTLKEADESLQALGDVATAAFEEQQTLFQEGRNLDDEAAKLPEQIQAAEAEVAARAPPAAPGLIQRVTDAITGKAAATEAERERAESIAADPAQVKSDRDFIKQLRDALAADELNAEIKRANTGKAPKDYEVESIEKRRALLAEVEAEFAPVQAVLDEAGEGGKPAQRLARLKARQTQIKTRKAEIATEQTSARQDAADVLLAKAAADLITAGRPKTESRLMATVWVEAFSSLSQRYGMSLEAMAGRFGLDIKAGEAPAQNTGELEQTAFHGGPHRFDKFDMSKIGTGEGAQAFGWGLYFAQAKEVADAYKRNLSQRTLVDGVEIKGGVFNWKTDPPRRWAEIQVVGNRDLDVAITQTKRLAGEGGGGEPVFLQALEILRDWKARDAVRVEHPGALYTVDLAPAEDEYLLWDKPLAEQSEKVKKAVESLRYPDGPLSTFVRDDKDAMTGEGIYLSIASALGQGGRDRGGQEAASRALAAAGIPGIKYLDQQSRGAKEGTFNYVIFDDKLINIVEMEQRKEGVKRGSLGIRKVGSGKLYTLTFYKEADASTGIHEFSHAFVDIFTELANDPAAPQQFRDDYATMVAEVGGTVGVPFTREQHELLAKKFEVYSATGKAPSTAMQRVFQTMRRWMLKVYGDVKNLGVTVSPEMTAVFGRWLATDEAIAAAEYESGADQTLSPEDIAQLEPDAQADYWAAFHAAGDQAREQVQTALLKEIGAESRAAFEAAVEQTKPAIRAQIDALPGPVALDRMASGDFPKIDRVAAAEVYDAATLKALDDAGALGASGIPPDAAREMLGFDSVDRMARDLVIASQRVALVDAAARSKVASEAGRFMSPAELKADARKATRSALYAARLRAELDALNALAGASEEGRTAAFRAVPSIQNLRAYAESKIAALAYRDIKPGQWLSGAKREARVSKVAMQAGKYQDAAEAKAKELLHFEMHRISANVKEAMATDARVIGRMQSAGRQSTVGKAGGQYRNHLNKLSARFGFSAQRPDEAAATGPLAGWIAQLQKQADEEGGFVLVPSVAEWITDSEATRDWRTLTSAELQDVRDAIEQVYTLGRDIHRAYAGNQAETLMERAAKVRDAIRASGKPLDRPFQAKPTGAQRYVAEHSPIDRYVAEIDGEAGGPLFDAFLRLRNEAEDSKSVRRRTANKAINAAFKNYKLAEKATFGLARQVPGTERSLSREHILMMALYEGSASGRALNRNVFQDAEVAAALRTLTKADAAWLNGMWEHEDSYWPEFKTLVEKVWGIAPPKIEAVQFRVVNAQGEALELRGGYTRVKYEGVRAHELSIADTANEIKQAAVIRSRPTASSRHAREKGVQQELRYDFGVVMEHIGEQIQALSVLESVHDMNFVLREVRDDLIDVRGREVYDEFTKAFKELAVGRLGAQSAAEQLASYFRAGVVVSKLGFKVGTNLINMTGIAASIDHLGPGVIREMAALNTNPVEFARAVKEMWAESRFMDTRAETFNRETNDIRNQLNKRFDMSSLEAIPMSMLALTQLWVDTPTYRVAKRQALAAGHDHAKAIAIAEQAVKDTQGSGLPADLPSVMREHKFFTVFMGYVNRQMNRTVSRVRSTEWTKPASVGRTALSLGLTWILPAAASVFMYSTLRGDDDEDPFWLSTLEETLLSMAGSGVLVRELASAYRFEKNYSGPAATALFDVFGETVGSLKDGKLTQRDFETTLSLAGIALHLPTAQALETYKGFKAYLAGRAGPQAMLLGPPRNRR